MEDVINIARREIEAEITEATIEKAKELVNKQWHLERKKEKLENKLTNVEQELESLTNRINKDSITEDLTKEVLKELDNE